MLELVFFLNLIDKLLFGLVLLYYSFKKPVTLLDKREPLFVQTFHRFSIRRHLLVQCDPVFDLIVQVLSSAHYFGIRFERIVKSAALSQQLLSDLRLEHLGLLHELQSSVA